MNYVVYRFYSTGGELLYVGRTGNMSCRLQVHQSLTNWFDEVATITVHHVATSAEAHLTERLAIQSEQPRHNVQHRRARPTVVAPPDLTATQQLAEIILGRPLGAYVADRRAEGLAWRRVARQLDIDTAGRISVSHEALRLWYGDAEEAVPA